MRSCNGRQVGNVVEEPCSLPSWNETSKEPPAPEGSLCGALQADAVVVGAGITGSSTALHLARMGKQVVQLEAREPGWGSSGRAYGSVVPVSKHSERKILQIYGHERGARLVSVLATGPAVVRGLLEEFQIDALYHGGGWAIGRAHATGRCQPETTSQPIGGERLRRLLSRCTRNGRLDRKFLLSR